MSTTETGTTREMTTAATATAADGPDGSGAVGSSGALPLATGRESLAVLWPLLRQRRGYLALVCLAGLIGSVAGLVAPWVIGRLVDDLPGSEDYTAVWIGAGAIAMAGIVGAGCTWAGQAWLARLTEPTVARLREMVMDRSLRLGAAQMETTETGDLVSRVAEDAREISQAATAVIPLVVQSAFTVIVSGVGLATVDWRLGLVGLLALPMYWTTLRWYLPRSGPIYAAERAAFGGRAVSSAGSPGPGPCTPTTPRTPSWSGSPPRPPAPGTCPSRCSTSSPAPSAATTAPRSPSSGCCWSWGSSSWTPAPSPPVP